MWIEGKTYQVSEKTKEEIKRALSLLRKEDGEEIIAKTCGDLHLSHEAPVARREELDWYEAMKRPLLELWYINSQIAPAAPLIYTGDIFDDGWREKKVPPQLINFALTFLPPGYGIPGQHDLPHHNLDDIKKSAFWTLVQSRRMKYLAPGESILDERLGKVIMYGYAWGTEVRPRADVRLKDHIHLAVIHDYCWMGNHSYQGAPEEKNVSYWSGLLKGYDVAVFGDNHKGFVYYQNSMGRPARFRNGGTFMIRKTDEIGYKPTIGLLTNHKRWINYELDTSKDVYSTDHLQNKVPDVEIDTSELVEEYRELGEKAFDFVGTMQRIAKKYDKPIEEIITRAMAKRHGK